MLDWLIKFSLKNRLLVIVSFSILLIYGGVALKDLPVDVFPDLNRPTVNIMTEVPGMAPEEVETLVTTPLERALNGVSGINRIRSTSGIGLSVIYVEFNWGSDVFKNRQLISEKLIEAKEHLPNGINPQMGPISSIMGEIQLVGLGLSSNSHLSPIDIRTYADWVIKPQLLAIPGVSQVITIGGGVKQYQIKISASKLNYYQLNIDEVLHHLSELSQNSTGGYLDKDNQEFLIRNLGKANNIEDVKNTVVGTHLGRVVFVKDIGSIEIDAQSKRGDAGINGKPGVVISISKQPGANTIELTKQIETALNQINTKLPEGMKLYPHLFEQADFIKMSIENIKAALRDASIFIIIVLILFLMNMRSTAITLTAIPLSFVVTFIVLKWMNLGINTMTLGGLAIAVGELVDDSIVDVENVLRRLKENHQKKVNQSILKTVFEASSEVRNSIVYATIIVCLVFLPLFFLDGLEGRLFIPLGIAYIVSLLSSLVVSLTLTPVMCSYLLTKNEVLEKQDGTFVKKLKHLDEKVLNYSLDNPILIFSLTFALFVGSLILIPFIGKDFLPKFNEGTAVIGVLSSPGISLARSNQIGVQAEELILSVPEVQSVSRRTGRAEQDEHAEGVHSSEIDVDFKSDGRKREIVLNEIRNKLSTIEGVVINLGQPISHRLDHMLSGVKAAVAIKLYGPDLNVLRKSGFEIKRKLEKIPGLVDLQVEQQVLIPQIKIQVLRDKASAFGLPAGQIVEVLEKTLNGGNVSQVLEDQRYFNIFMRFDEESRSNLDTISNMIVKILPDGRKVKLNQVADVYESTGPNVINHENSQRRIVVMANTHARDIEAVHKDIELALKDLTLKDGYYIHYDGQLEKQQKGMLVILLMALFSILGIYLVLFLHFRSHLVCLQIMLNIPLALIGSIIAVFLTDKVFTLASLVAFVTLCGIASRNGIMMISHYMHLIKYEKQTFSKEMVIKGSLERLVPVLMTALTAMLALIPILLSKGEPGKEILYPLSVVIVGGLFSSTLLDMVVTPTLFYYLAKKSFNNIIKENLDEEFDF